MKRFFITLSFLIVALLACAAVSPLGAAEASASSYVNEEGTTIIDTNWWFEEIAVEINVRRDKRYEITETMKVGFINGDRNTGIIRDIQRVSQTTRVIDGKQESGETYIAGISDVSVTINGEPALVTQSLYDSGNFYSVKMQKQDVSYFPATDQKAGDYNEFVLSYVYDMSDDKAAGYDDFTFDVLGYAMDYTKKFSAVITFPEPVDEASVSFRTNNKKAWSPNEEKGESVSVEGNTVSLTAYPFKEHIGYTVQVLLPDGYFSVERTFLWYYIVFAVLAAAGIAAGVVIFAGYCPRKPIEQIEFYPPEGMRAMRFSAMWHSAPREKDVAAVILQWASEGYVRLEQDGKRDLIVYKLKNPPDDLPQSERDYFNAIFPADSFTGSESFSTKQMRRGADVKRARRISTSAQMLREIASKPDPLKKGNIKAHILLTVASLVPMLSTFVYFCIVSAMAFPLFFFVFMAAGTAVGSMQARARGTPILYIFPLAFMGIPLFAFFSISYLPLYDYFGLLYISLAWWAVALVLLHFMRRRNPEAQAELGKMRGFRRFLLTAELSRLERQLYDDPEYYYSIIPFCMIMGISRKVDRRFAALNVPLPEWAGGIPMRSFSAFSHSLSSSSGGGGSGGGHGGSSGGGGGGGGSRGC